MAYDFGSNTLGIKNPFRIEGVLQSIAGVVIALLGVMPLLGVAGALADNQLVIAWCNAGLGFVLLAWGLRHSGSGLFKLFRYFVGRSVPTSLAYNLNPSERDNAEAEKKVAQYSASKLESMLMGRKNSTFIEPRGWQARLIHTLLPKLVFLPAPMRNFVQEIGGLIIAVLVGLLAFAIAYFVSVSGLAGKAGQLITPILSLLLMIYLLQGWRRAATRLKRRRNSGLEAKNARGLAFLILFAILVPVLVGYLYNQFDLGRSPRMRQIFDALMQYDAWFNLLLLALVSIAVIGLSGLLLAERFRRIDMSTDVSEYRDNLQESVHPNELFINIENIVLANRRYKEVPNRIYKNFDPQLDEQSQGKGSFSGQLLVETQPEFIVENHSRRFAVGRLIATIGAELLFVISAGVFYLLVQQGIEIYSFVEAQVVDARGRVVLETLQQLGALSATAVTLLFAFATCLAAARILGAGAHLFWAEMRFQSLLLWMKMEGTFTESKISTGMSIHDSTRSENVVVRSSITPWVLTSRILSSTFASSGMNNLESGRYVMTMRSNDDELGSIVNEITGFLKGRETIASIRNESDLGNAT